VNGILVAALAVSWAIVGFQAWLLYLMVRQHGRTLLAQDELRTRVGATEAAIRGLSATQPVSAAAPAQPRSLDLGAAAPDFRLPDPNGRFHRLADFAGRPNLFVFFNPDCGFCQQLAPELGRMPKESPHVVLLSRGTAQTHVSMARQHGWSCDVLLEPGWEVATKYGTNATPTAYLIDSKGSIASTLAVGVPAVLELARAMPGSNGNGHAINASALKEKETAAADRARAAGLAVTESRIAREGLAPGTTAPDFSLPDLRGRRRRLSDFLGRRQVLLVFSDPGCGPCQALTPQLEEIHRAHRSDGLQVLMVTRGDVAANKQKARDHGVTFPVLLQRQWEVSRDYAMFATPVGYLISNDGVVASPVAIGADAILDLASGGARAAV
jgi:peroxiredoxin